MLEQKRLKQSLHTASSSPAAVSPLDAPCTLCHPCMLAFLLQNFTQNKCWKALPWSTSISLSGLPLFHHALVRLCWKHQPFLGKKALKERPFPAATVHVPPLSLAKRGSQGLHVCRLKPQLPLLDVQREGGSSGPPHIPLHPSSSCFLGRCPSAGRTVLLPTSTFLHHCSPSCCHHCDFCHCVFFASITSITNTCRAADAS